MKRRYMVSLCNFRVLFFMDVKIIIQTDIQWLHLSTQTETVDVFVLTEGINKSYCEH